MLIVSRLVISVGKVVNKRMFVVFRQIFGRYFIFLVIALLSCVQGIPEATGLAPPAPCLSPEIPAETSSTAPTVPTQAAVSVAEANAAPLDHFPQVRQCLHSHRSISSLCWDSRLFKYHSMISDICPYILLLQGMPALDAGGGGDAEALDFLRSNPQVHPPLSVYLSWTLSRSRSS